MHGIRKLALGGFVLAAILGEPLRSTPTIAQSTVTNIIATDFDYAPKELNATAGALSIQLHNAGARRHNLVTLRHTDGVEIESQLIRSGETTE